MIALLIAVVIVALLFAGAVVGDRRRRAHFGYISRRDLLKYK
jgi:hypothetical protein